MTDHDTEEITVVESAGLVVDPKGEGDTDFEEQLERTLEETEFAIKQKIEPDGNDSWHEAREVIKRFRPVPWFIWRLCHFVLGRTGQTPAVPEGLVLGLRRLLFAAASDPILGTGEKVNEVRKALQVLPPDVVAGAAVVYSVCRRLASNPGFKSNQPIIDDALLRARIGFALGKNMEGFGAGRGMLAGFAGRCGLAILLSSGEAEKLTRALELLATGQEISQVGLELFNCDPLQVSAMLLSVAGCSRDAAFGTVSYALTNRSGLVDNEEQRRWLAVFAVVEAIRLGKSKKADDILWKTVGLANNKDREVILDEMRSLSRRGHSWQWMFG